MQLPLNTLAKQKQNKIYGNSKKNPGKTLLTAFGPFPGVPRNPSSALLKEFLSISNDNTNRIMGEFIETSYEFCRYWSNGVPIKDFSLIIHLGVAMGSPNFRLEKIAKNQCSPYSPDINGKTWDKDCICQDENQAICTDLNIEKIVFQR